jgi:Spy/CpxP family protein refolding chaperone
MRFPSASAQHDQGEQHMKISKGLLGLALCTAMSAFALAQNGGAPSGDQQQGGQREGRGPGGRGGMNPEERLKRLTTELNLTADQQAKVKTIVESEKTKMDALRDDTSVEGDAKREKAMAIRKDSQDAIRAALTADQQAKFDKMQADMKNRGERRGPPPPPPNN